MAEKLPMWPSEEGKFPHVVPQLRGTTPPCHIVTMGENLVGTLYDCNGRWAAFRTYVYVFMARDGDGPMYVKIGRSDNPVMRIGNVQTGCPIRIIKAGMVKVLNIEQAKRLEAELHIALAAHSTTGEWFKFDWTNTEHRDFLSATLKVVFAVVPEWKMEEINLEHARAFMREMMRKRQEKHRKRKRRGRAVLDAIADAAIRP